MSARTLLALSGLLALLMVTSSCNMRRGTVVSGPGETPGELAAAGEGLAAVAESVPLLRVRVSNQSGVEERRTVGVAIEDGRRLLVDAASLTVEDEDSIGSVATRSIEVIFHPGGDDERRHPAEVVREDAESGMALLAVDGPPAPAVSLGDDVADGARVVLISSPASIGRIIAETGTVRGYTETDRGRFLTHTAGYEANATGPVFDTEGALVGLQISAAPGERMAIPAVEIAQWLHTPTPEALSPDGAGEVLGELLRQMAAEHRLNEAGTGYVLPRPGIPDVLVKERQGVISVEVDLGTLHVGDAIEALRSNYSDPLGALALRPAEGADQLLWVARLATDAANAEYLEYATRIAVLQRARWEQIAAGADPPYPYEHYPGGDEETLNARLAEIIRRAEIPHEPSGDGFRLHPDAEVPVYATIFQGMAYVYAYSGGMPGERASAREQIARELLRRNWELRLGRLVLDKHMDLAWEAQVPVEHLTPDDMAALVGVCQDEITRIESAYGRILFNEQ